MGKHRRSAVERAAIAALAYSATPAQLEEQLGFPPKLADVEPG